MKKGISPSEEKVRLSEVARLAKVSPSTVSRALNAPGLLKPNTLEKVLLAIEQIGYVPDLNAGALKSQRSRTIGAIVPTLNSAVFAQTVQGLQSELELQGYQLLVGQSLYSQASEDELVLAFLGRRVDGLVLTGAQHSVLTRERLLKAAVPVVETWDLPKRALDMAVGFSNYQAGRAMARYLVAKGFTQIGFAGGSDERTGERLRGFKAVLRAQPKLQLVQHLMPAGASMEDACLAMRALLQEAPRLRAAFFSNDVLAMAAMMECQRLGLRIPQDIAIAGFADLEIARHLVPSLTSVQVHALKIGQESARLLLSRLNSVDSNRFSLNGEVIDLGFEVVARQSA